MKKPSFQLLLFAITMLMLSTNVLPANIQRRTIRFVENYKQGGKSFVTQNLPKKVNRLSAKKGNIVLIYDEGLPDSIKISFEVAKQLWESKIHNTQPIYIEIDFESLDSNIAMESYVSYCGEQYEYPGALMSQLANLPYGTEEVPDGLILLNVNQDWNCTFTDTKYGISGYNIATMTLRGIARCLGFGASVSEIDENSFVFDNGWPTIFDQKLISQNQKLSNIESGSEEMASFVTSDNVYYKSNTQSHAIYAPKTYSPNESLCYLKQNNSLMSQTLGTGNIFLDIDNATVDILNSLGWDLPESGLSIECSDISENGIGSSYSSHTFSLTKSQNSITKYSWKFMLKDRSGNFVQISTSDSPQFTINKINNPDNYFININGDLEGRIECRYTINGKEADAIPFSLSLELKPVIFSVDNVKVYRNDNEFTVSLDARYAGAEHIYLEVEEEYSSSLRNYMFNQPFFAHMTSGKISSLYYSWVTVLVTNEYGSAEHTIEFEPVYYDDSQMREDEESLSLVINGENESCYIELSDISYQYEMFYDGQGKADCIGVLDLTINIPSEYYLVSFTKSRKHLEDSSQFRGIGVKTVYQNVGPTIHIVMDKISWGTYFRTQLLLNLEDRFLAPDFCVDDYMDPADLAIIKGQTEIAEVESDVVAIAGKNGLIEIDTPCNIYLNVYSIDGKHIFGGDISGHYSLPVHGNLMVVQYTLNGKTVTKKISTL